MEQTDGRMVELTNEQTKGRTNEQTEAQTRKHNARKWDIKIGHKKGYKQHFGIV